MFCTYLTIYYGSLLPRRYVGSTSISNIHTGYHGSVLSEEWKEIWNQELISNPHLFKTRILTLHDTREKALEKEKEIQIKYDVVKNPNYINKSLANPNGFFGMNVSGKNNPNYGNSESIKKWYKENPELASERNRKAAITQWNDEEQRKKKIQGMIGKKKTRKTLTQEEFEKLQSEKGKKGAEGLRLKKSYRIFYNNTLYYGFAQFEAATGINKHYARKMAKNNELRIEKP